MIKSKKSIENLTPYKTDKYKQSWRLKLDSNENIYGTSNAVISAIKNFNPEDISIYPCYGKLVDKIAQKYNLNTDNIILTNGCDEALNILITTYLDNNDEILSYNPCFSMPDLYAEIQGGKVKKINYDDKFIFNKNTVLNNITTSTKIFYIATPNNPTGETVKASILELIIQEKPNTLFIIDCTYVNFASDVAFGDYLDLAKKYNNVAVVKSFSKDYGLAGLRLGFVVANNVIIKELQKIASPYNVNIIAISCAIAAMNDEKYFEEIKELNIQAKELLYQGLLEKGGLPHKSQGNFILCDFGDYADFYYNKLKNNGVIVRNYSKNSILATYLRITVPKIGGVKFILELLNKKDLIIFDLDGVVFDVRESYNSAIAKTFQHFAGYEINQQEINEIKNQGGMNCDWDAVQCLLLNHNIKVEYIDIINIFQELFYNPNNNTKEYLIDKEKLIISKEIFEELSKTYDMVVFSGRLKEEAIYSLKKFEIDKYFSYFVTCDDLPKNMLKPHPQGVLNILQHCPFKTIKYFGDSVDDIIAGNKANVETIGVISPGADFNSKVNNFKHLGAKYILDDAKNIIGFLEDCYEQTH